MVAGLAYAFLPFHVAHATNHPHVAQTQWLPLYFLALWRCLDRPDLRRASLLLASAAAVALSNFYGGLIAAVLSPVALVAYGVVSPRRPGEGRRRRLVLTGLTLAAAAAAGLLLIHRVAPARPASSGSLRLPPLRPLPLQREMVELSRPRGGPPAGRVPGAGVLGRARPRGGAPGAAGGRGLVAPRPGGRAAMALAARRSDLARGPQRSRPGEPRRGRPPLLALSRAEDRVLHVRAPVRVAVRGGADVPGLCAVRRGGRPHDRAAGGGGRRLPVAAAGVRGPPRGRCSCWAWPSWSSRPSLPGGGATCCRPAPTDGSRRSRARCGCWTACLRPESSDSLARSLLGHEVSLLGAPTFDDCGEPRLGDKLTAMGYTHVVVRRDSTIGRWLAANPAPEGLARGPEFEDGLDPGGEGRAAPRVRERPARLLPSRIQRARPPGAGWGRRGR